MVKLLMPTLVERFEAVVRENEQLKFEIEALKKQLSEPEKQQKVSK